MFVFISLISVVVFQRLFELRLAKQNEIFLKGKGAIEFGRSHYKWVVALHTLFLASLSFEVLCFPQPLSSWWVLPCFVFLACQVFRVWIIRTLGPYWNTKIVVLPGAKVIEKGPYAWIKHPNYLIVSLEILSLPLIFQAYATAILFTAINALLILGVRIPEEEAALKRTTNYGEYTLGKSLKRT